MAGNSNIPDQRRGRLLELIRGRGFAALEDLSGDLGVSTSTIRRDIDALVEAGEVQRTHGGVFYTGPSPGLQHFAQKQSGEWEKKRKIARAVDEMIVDGDTILLDGGSTTYELARKLLNRPLQIVTNSLPIANLFAESEVTDLVFVGGYLHPRTGVSIGPYAIEMLKDIHVRRAIISVSSVNAYGFYNSNLLLVETERAMMSAADEVVVVADSTKFGHQSLSKLCELDGVDYLVVDDELNKDWQDQIRTSGVKLVIGTGGNDDELLAAERWPA